MWRALEPHRPNEGWTNGYAMFEVTGRAQRPVEACTRTVAEILSQYETFRTHFRRLGDGRLRQVVQRESTVAVASFPPDGVPADFAVSAFDIFAPPLLRIALEVDGSDVRRLHLAWSHLLLDAFATQLVCDHLGTTLSGGEFSADAVIQPVDRSAWETSAEGLRYNRRSLEHWRAQLPQFPARYTHVGDERQSGFLLGRLEAPQMVEAATQLGARFKVSVPTVLIAAVTQTLCELTGMERLPFLLRTSNHVGKHLRTIAQLTQDAPAVYAPMRGGDDASGSLPDLHRQLLLAQGYGAYHPADLDQLIDSFAQDGVGPDRRVLFNCLPVGMASTTKGETGFQWIGERDFDPVLFYADVYPADGVFVFMLDTRFVSREQFEAAMPKLAGLPESWSAP